MDHSKDEFARGRVHINGIEGFWGMAKVRLAKFKGLPKHTFHLHLKETEWRYNHRSLNTFKILLGYLRENPLSLGPDPYVSLICYVAPDPVLGEGPDRGGVWRLTLVALLK